MGFSKNVAINNQYACRTIIEADAQFEKSCALCCMSPYNNINCSQCRVQQTHNYIIEKLKAEITVADEA